MANFVAPKVPDPELPVFFNVNGVVGAQPAQNLREDVLLVQFAFQVIGNTAISTSNQDVIAAAKQVKVTGFIDQPTINAIMTMQRAGRNKNQVADGRVSPAKGEYSYGGALWTIVHLNSSMQQRNVDIWPRIDKIPGCPPELKQMVTRTVAGV